MSVEPNIHIEMWELGNGGYAIGILRWCRSFQNLTFIPLQKSLSSRLINKCCFTSCSITLLDAKIERIFKPLISRVKNQLQQKFALMPGREGRATKLPKSCPLISSRVKHLPFWLSLKSWKGAAQTQPRCRSFDPCFWALLSPWPPFVSQTTKVDERSQCSSWRLQLLELGLEGRETGI